tara:strand:- start:4008 stop:6713 length:2706 start_codon:yes stop_codon:yes gene_type:complete
MAQVGSQFSRFITAINITNAGSGYSSVDQPTLVIGAPTTTVVGATTTQATASLTISSNSVSSVTITDKGLGYLTAPEVYLVGSLTTVNITTTPDVTRTAGTYVSVGGIAVSGSGAEFTVVIDGAGAITSVTPTTAGTNYKPGETITILDESVGGFGDTTDITVTVATISQGGSGATFTADMGVYNIQSKYYHQNFSYLIEQQIPEFIRAEYPQFTTFIKKYFQFLDTEPNPNYVLQELHDQWNVDDYHGSYIESLLQSYAIDFPIDTKVQSRLLIKRIRDFYEAKGSIEGVKAFFKLVYGEEIEIFKPSEYILKPSDGIYTRDVVCKVYANETLTPRYNPLDFRGREVDIVYYTSEGSITKRNRIQSSITRTKKIAYTNPDAFELTLSIPAETVIPGYGVEGSLTATVSGGAITAVTVTNPGQGYSANPVAIILPDSGDTITKIAQLQVRINSTTNTISDVVITDGGAGYTVAPSLALDTDSVRTWMGDRGIADENINRKAFLTRVLNKVVTKTNTGTSDGGFKIGDTFQVQETGDILGVYALDYFQDDYTLTGISNNAYIRITQLDSNNYPSSMEVIATGTGFQRASFDFLLTSENSETQTITATTGFNHTFPGKWKNVSGFLSDANRLQDNEIYQQFSYQVKSSLSKTTWGLPLQRAAHPAGMVAFSDLNINHVVGAGTNFNIIPDVFIFRIFQDIETVVVSDLPSLGLHKPAIANSVVVSDVEPTLEPGLVKNENPLTQDIEFFDITMAKFETPEMSENVSKNIVKPNITDSITFGETVEALLFFYRTPIDVIELTETVLLAIELTKSDSFVVNDSDTLTPGLGKTEVLDMSDEVNSFNVTKQNTDNPAVNDVPAKSIERGTISDTTSMSESGTIVSQDYAEITYFNSDYVGEARIIS